MVTQQMNNYKIEDATQNVSPYNHYKVDLE